MADPAPQPPLQPPTAHTPPHASIDPFYTHLISLLSVYEMGPYPGASVPVPRYSGPSNWETDQILRSLGVVAKRMWVAEERVRGLMVQGQQCRDEKHGKDDERLGFPSNISTTGGDTSAPWTPLVSTGLPPPTASSMDFSNAADAHAGSVNVQVEPSDGYPFAAPASINTSPPMTLSPDSLTGVQGSTFEPPTAAEDASPLSATEELQLLKAQVSDVARVCNAVARGDLSQKIMVPVQGVIMVQLKDVINGMVDKLVQFAKEITRVSQEVGTEGKLCGQALVLDVEGTWRELTGVVNKLAANLTVIDRST